MRSTLTSHLSLFAFLASSALLLHAQTPSTQANPLPSSSSNAGAFRAQFAQPAVPHDPLELVTGDAQPIQSANQRSAVIKALSQAHALSNVRAFPYYRKTTFTSFGSTSSEGTWQLEDMSPGANLYRWTAQGPSYSAVDLFTDQMLHSNQPGAAIPVRLAQVRSAIFFMRPFVGPRATLRTAVANLNGAALECILLSHMGIAKEAMGGRRWDESEYCVDTASGVLITYSSAPGLYVLYDYSQAIRFHDLLIPNKFTISQAGRTIVEAQTTGVSDPPNDPSLHQQLGLSQVGAGPLMAAPWDIHSDIPSADLPPGSSQVVVLHGMQSSSGQITDSELLASSDSALDSTAVKFASNSHQAPDDAEPGATPQSREVLMTITFFGALH